MAEGEVRDVWLQVYEGFQNLEGSEWRAQVQGPERGVWELRVAPAGSQQGNGTSVLQPQETVSC